MQYRRIVTLFAVLALMSLSAWAQDKSKSDPVSGSYKGSAKSDAFGELPLTAQIKNNSGKLSGTVGTPQGDAEITDGTYADGKITLKFDAGGNEGTVSAQIKDGKIVGEWTLAGASGTLELMKADDSSAGSGSSPAPAASSAGDPLTGEWDGTAEAAGNEVAFTLKLKVDGTAVTGESTSAMGTATISKGSWMDNKLSMTLDTPNGALTFTATIVDGKLSGDFDFAGQMTGKWSATKKK